MAKRRKEEPRLGTKRLKRLAYPEKDSRPEAQALLAACKQDREKLIGITIVCDDHWGAEDRIYRFYHHSFKVYQLQDLTETMVKALQALMPDVLLNEMFRTIVGEGTEKTFELSDNARWERETRPIVEAYFHARYMVDMAIKYAAELEEAPACLPSGWAALLYLYNLR